MPGFRMRICFIWTSHFKNLNNFGINLCNDFKFSYSPDTHEVSKVTQTALPSEIFGENILDITAILGINGAGKTNALELICLALKSNERIDTPSIVVYELHGELFYINSTNNEVTTNFPAQRRADFKDIKDLNVIYFSNVFDENQMDLGKHVQDISANFKHSRRGFALGRARAETDIIYQLQFIYSTQFPKVRIETPRRIEIKVDRSIRRTNIDRDHKLVGFYKKISELQFSMRKQRLPDKNLQRAVIAIQGLFLYQLLTENIECEEFTHNIDQCLNKLQSEPIDFREPLFAARQFFKTHEELDLHHSKPTLTKLIEVAIELEHILRAMNIRLDESLKSSRYSFTIDFDKDEPLPYLELAWIIELIRSGSINWTSLSSGQKAYLNMFSSIWISLSNTGISKNSNSGTLLCIDEADLYLHPKWQTEFIERLITCLPGLSEQKSQIVITTHSPILVSDLPSQCLIALLPQCGGPNAVPPSEELKTFGANLFDIYASTFGLKGQRSGNISAKYISKILTILDADEISPHDLDVLRQAASIIDDQLIKSHIIKRISSK